MTPCRYILSVDTDKLDTDIVDTNIVDTDMQIQTCRYRHVDTDKEAKSNWKTCRGKK